jgi:hypothetical protein
MSKCMAMAMAILLLPLHGEFKKREGSLQGLPPGFRWPPGPGWRSDPPPPGCAAPAFRTDVVCLPPRTTS